MHCKPFPIRRSEQFRSLLWAVAIVLVASLAAVSASPLLAQESSTEQSDAGVDSTNRASTPLRQARYVGNAILIHLPTNKARALVLPEPVKLKGNSEQLPGVEIAYEQNVIGFFASNDFSSRTVSLVGVDSGTEYLLRIRASENGIASPLQIVR